MDWLAILQQIFEVAIIPLLGLATSVLIVFLKKKAGEVQEKINSNIYSKYFGLLTETVLTCVQATTQTYVDALKKEGRFDKEAQKKAFEMTYQAIMSTLKDDAKIYLKEILGDLDLYITNLIESMILETKK